MPGKCDGKRNLGGDNGENYTQTYRKAGSMPGGLHVKEHIFFLELEI